ncbi:MAG: STAS domain-containing protein [Victivallales bacterium]|nr:STAS domain-containing protein [Victivallales bacterium]
MDYHYETVDNVLKVSLDGRLVAACSEEFKKEMFERLKEAKNILFDLSKMSHIDSSGLGALVSILQVVNANGGVIKLACIQSRPKIVFDITKVYRVFDIYDTVEAALAAFNAPA